MLNHCIIMASSKPTITVEPSMIERSTTSIMVVKTVIKEIHVVKNHNGARREEERVRREDGYSEGKWRIQCGYSESTVGYSEDTVRVH